jgi:NCS2 family nucleobase:cation symporter-2
VLEAQPTEDIADTVDARPPVGRLFVLGLQHVLVMYAGTVAVPLLVASALKLPPDQTAFLITADLFAAGLATLIQTLGIWKFGAPLPVMMGATFLSVGPIIAMGVNPAVGLPGFYGATLASGFVGVLSAPLIGRILALFPPVVTGSLIALLGISLLSVAMNWAGGGPASSSQTINGVSISVTNPAYGQADGLGIALFVFAIILLMTKYARGIWHSVAVMTGMAVGTLISIPLGFVHVKGLAEASWIAFVPPFRFGMPEFHLGPIVTMSIVMIITFVESTGVFIALSEITGKPFGRDDLVQALRADGLGIMTGAIFNAFPYTSFSQNVGLVSITTVRSRFVCAMGGIILIVLGLLPKMACIVAAVPEPVLGGAGIVMFGMVAATGVRILSAVDFQGNHHNLFIVASSIGLGMIPTLSPHLFQHLPPWAAPITGSSVVLGTIVAVILNLFLNGSQRTSKGQL